LSPPDGFVKLKKVSLNSQSRAGIDAGFFNIEKAFAKEYSIVEKAGSYAFSCRQNGYDLATEAVVESTDGL
jgi:hypothetical protein